MDIKRSIVLVFFSLFLSSPPVSYAVEKNAGSSAKLATKSAEIAYDKRIRILKEFLRTYDSPLTLHSESFIKFADTYQLDYRLLAAISGVESTFGKQLPEKSYNAWGWGIYEDHMIYFKSFDEGVETISKALREDYINAWKAKDVYQIGRFYAASPTWAQRVVYFMNKIEQFAQQKPSASLSISI